MTTPPWGADPASETPAPPVCPRHPDRESYVRCQRCERPVCPECQRPAAVGIQCVDCVRDQAKGMPVARSAFGGRAGAGERPLVTLVMIGICVLVFLVQQASGGIVTGNFAFRPYFAEAEPYRFLTSAYLHGGVMHILFNMYALYLTGPYLEHLFGRARFLALYLLSALGGSAVYLAMASPSDEQQWFGGAVGASGAVFGLFAALVVANRRLGRESGQILGIIAINGVIGFVLPGIAWQAHLGGLVVGAAVAAVLAYAPRARRTLVQVAGMTAVAVVIGLLVAVKIGSTPAVFFA